MMDNNQLRGVQQIAVEIHEMAFTNMNQEDVSEGKRHAVTACS